jgi:hypothetical protein
LRELRRCAVSSANHTGGTMFTNFGKHIQRACGIFLIPLMLLAIVGNPSNLEPTSTSNLMQFISNGHALGFSSDGMYVAAGTHTLRVDFVKANSVEPKAALSARTDGQTAATLNRVTYSDLWPGVSLTYDAPAGTILRSTYTVLPGASSSSIRLHYNAPLTLNSDGTLDIAYKSGVMNESAPIAWQEIGGKRVPVDVQFQLASREKLQTVSFLVGSYDLNYSLVIDPGLTWHSFLGSDADDYSRGLAIDSDGNLYVTGNSASGWGCELVDCTVLDYTGAYDAFVAKLDGSTGELIWNTFLGGIALDDSMGIAVDVNGNVYVSGYSNETWGSPLRENSGGVDGFAAKLDSASGALIWNTFLGGTTIDRSWGVDVDDAGNVYITGNSTTAWSCQPVECTIRDFSDVEDAYIAKLDSSGTLVWNTFLGGMGTDVGYGITVDGSGKAYVSGYSDADWGSALRPYSGAIDGFAAKLDSSGALVWNTFLGGEGVDLGYGIGIDGSNSVYIAGSSYTTWGSPLREFGGGLADGFAAKLNPNGALSWNTFVGGDGYDYCYGIIVDTIGNIYVAGSSDATWGTPLRDYGAGLDGFAAKLSSEGLLRASAFLGGDGSEKGYGIAVFGDDENVYLSGYSDATWGEPLRVYTSGQDAFAAKLDLTPPMVASIMLGSPNPTAAGSVNYILTFTEPVTGVDADDLSLTMRDITGATVSGIVGSDSIYTVTVATGTGNGFIHLDLVDNDSILNGAGKPLGGAGEGNGSYSGGEEYMIVRTAPVLITPVNGIVLHYNLPAFDWSNFPGATAYQIQISKNVTFTQLVTNTTLTGATNSAYTPKVNLTVNTTLFWRVRARLGRLYTPWSVIFSIKTANPPGAPVLVAPASNALVGDSAVLFDWKAPTIPVNTVFDHYQIEIATNSTFTTLVHKLDIPGIANSQDTTAVLSPSTKYFWHVRAYNSVGDYSAWSPTRIVKTRFVPPTLQLPGEDVPSIAPNTHTRRPTFSWAAVPSATTYTVEVSTSNTFASKAINATAATNLFTPTSDLAANTTYYWRVRANGIFGPSLYSSPVKTFKTGDSPTVPTLTAPIFNALVATKTPLLDWNAVTVPAGSPDFYGYDVQISGDSAFLGIVSNLSVSGIDNTSVTTPILPGGATYYWRVRAWNVGVDNFGGNEDDDFSGWSLVRTVRVIFDAPVQILPIDGAITVARKPTFSWSAIPGVLNYGLQVSASASFTSLLVNVTVNSKFTTYTPTTSLPVNSLLYWRVRANGSYGPGFWQSPVFTFTIIP